MLNLPMDARARVWRGGHGSVVERLSPFPLTMAACLQPKPESCP